MRWLTNHWHAVAAHVAALFTLAWLAVDYLADPRSFTFGRTFMLRTGSAGLILLVASLACTPASRLLHWPRATQIRRTLGLYAMLYISLHLATYALFDVGLDPYLIWRDLGERRAMSVGLAAFLLLIPLALTSTKGWQRRLGKNWKVLHRLVFIAAPAAVLHFFLLDRDFVTQPVIFGIIVGLLLALRLPPVRAALNR